MPRAIRGLAKCLFGDAFGGCSITDRKSNLTTLSRELHTAIVRWWKGFDEGIQMCEAGELGKPDGSPPIEANIRVGVRIPDRTLPEIAKSCCDLLPRFY